MLSLPVLILLAITVIGALACVIITYRAHHTAVSLLERHTTAPHRQGAFHQSAHDPTQPLEAPRPRRKRRPGRWALGILAVIAGALYLWQGGANAAVTAAHTGPAPAHTNASGWAILIVLAALIVTLGILRRRSKKGQK